MILHPHSIGRKRRYGALYNWHAVDKGIAPAGYSVPTKAQYETMITYLGGSMTAAEALKSIWLWKDGYNGTDKVDFRALPGGFRSFEGSGVFSGLYEWALFYTSSLEVVTPYFMGIDHISAYGAHLTYGSGIANNKNTGASVRFIKNDQNMPSSHSLIDLDGNVYKLIQLGDGTIFTAQNWKCTKYANGTAVPIITDNIEWGLDTDGAMCYYDNDIKNS